MTLLDAPIRFTYSMDRPEGDLQREADGVVWADGAVTLHYPLDTQPFHQFFPDVRAAHRGLCQIVGSSRDLGYFTFYDDWANRTDVIPAIIAARASLAGRPFHSRFKLQRTIDATGVSGTGHVADGVRWYDGSASLRWRPTVRSHGLYDSVEDLEAIHGHDGQTKVVYLDKILIDLYPQGTGPDGS